MRNGPERGGKHLPQQDEKGDASKGAQNLNSPFPRSLHWSCFLANFWVAPLLFHCHRVIIATTIASMAALTTAAGACAGSVDCLAYGQAELNLWEPKRYEQEEKTGTVIVVQVINTVLDTTSYSTLANNVPSAYVPPLTNEGGTKIASIIYEHRGTVSTTTVYVFLSTTRAQADD